MVARQPEVGIELAESVMMHNCAHMDDYGALKAKLDHAEQGRTLWHQEVERRMNELSKAAGEIQVLKADCGRLKDEHDSLVIEMSDDHKMLAWLRKQLSDAETDRDSLREQLARSRHDSIVQHDYHVATLNECYELQRKLILATEALFAAAADLDRCAVKLGDTGTGGNSNHANSCFEEALQALGLSQSQYSDVYAASENGESVFEAIAAYASAPANPKDSKTEDTDV